MADHLDFLKTAFADRYAIERKLGRGGMATVYLALHLKRAPRRTEGPSGGDSAARRGA